METTQKQTFDAALEDFIAEVERVTNKTHAGDSVRLYVTHIEASAGPKYTKLMRVETGPQGYKGSSYYGFIRNSDGAVLYAGGPKPFIGKSEATTVRGNIFDASTWERCIGPYGVLTLSRR
jgi:hypothetical protein